MTDINRIIDRVLVLDKELNTNLPFEKKIAIWATLEIEMVASAVLIARECERLRRLRMPNDNLDARTLPVDSETFHKIRETDAKKIDKLTSSLQQCASQFRFYEQSHNSKTPPDTHKAETNRMMAELCEEALR